MTATTHLRGKARHAASYPASLDDLRRKHGALWEIRGSLRHYHAARRDLSSTLSVFHATAEGLDRALAALGDCR